MTLGNQVDAIVVDGKTTIEAAITRLEQIGARSGSQSQYRDPRPMVSRVLQVPESGIW